MLALGPEAYVTGSHSTSVAAAASSGVNGVSVAVGTLGAGQLVEVANLEVPVTVQQETAPREGNSSAVSAAGRVKPGRVPSGAPFLSKRLMDVMAMDRVTGSTALFVL